MMKKQAFTLIEILVSIALFTIIILFLFQTLDMTQKTNNFYSQKLEEFKDSNELKKLLFLDFIKEKEKSTAITLDREKNTILQFQSTNFYHNPFYINVTYLVSRNKNLLRIESANKFDSKKLNDSFFETSFVDRVDNNISKFKVSQSNNKIFFYIEKENNQKILFSF